MGASNVSAGHVNFGSCYRYHTCSWVCKSQGIRPELTNLLSSSISSLSKEFIRIFLWGLRKNKNPNFW